MKRIPSWRSIELNGVIRFSLLTGIFLTVTLVDLKALKPFDPVKFSAIWCFGWLAIGLWVVQLIRGRSRRMPFASGRAAGFFLAAVGLATLFSHTFLVSFFGWYQRYGGFLSVLLYVSLVVLIVNLYRGKPDDVRELLYVLGEASIVVVLYIFVQWARLDPINWARASGKPTKHLFFGTLGNSNFAGDYLGFMVPWLWYAFRRAQARWLKAAVVAWSLAHLWALLLTSARGGLLAAAIGVGVLVVLHHRLLPSWTKVAAAAAAAAVAVVAVLVIWHPGSARPPGPLAHARIFRSRSLDARGYWWLAGLRTFASRPIVGTGPDTFVREYPRHLSPKAARIPDTESADKPHNVFVEYAAATGVLGLGAYLLLVFSVYRRGLRRRRLVDGDERLMLTTLLAMFAAYLGQAFVSIDVVPIAMSSWVVLGAIIALCEPAAPAAERAARAGSLRRNAGIVGVVLMTIALFAYGAIRLDADHEMRNALRQTQQGAAIEDVVATYQRAISLQPFEPVYRGTAADFLEKHANDVDDRSEKRLFLEASVRVFKRMNALQPGFFLWKMTLAQAMADLAAAGGSATFDDADAVFREAQRAAPYDWRVPVAWAGKLNLRATATRTDNFHCLALDQFARAVSLRPSEAKPWLGLGETLVILGRLPRAVDAFQQAVNNALIEVDQLNARHDLQSALTKLARVRAKHLRVKRISCS
jgi:O-antigen ligase